MPRTADESRRAEASRLYHSSRLSVREVSLVMGCDEKTVRRWLGDSMRRRGPRGRTDVSDARLLAALADDPSPTRAAKATGLSRGAVRKRIERLAGE